MYFLLYILIMFLLAGIAVTLNLKYEWITQSDIDFDASPIIIVGFLLLFWPIGIFFAAIAGLCYLIYRFLP